MLVQSLLCSLFHRQICCSAEQKECSHSHHPFPGFLFINPLCRFECNCWPLFCVVVTFCGRCLCRACSWSIHAVQRSNLGVIPWDSRLPFAGVVFTKLARLTGHLAPEAACPCLSSAGSRPAFLYRFCGFLD